MLKKIKVRRECTVSSPITWPPTKTSDGTEKFTTTGSVDICSVLSEIQLIGTSLHVDTTQVSCVWGRIPLMEAARERPEFDIKPTLWALLLIFSSRVSPNVFSTRGYLRKTAGFEIRVFPLLGELPKAIEPHLPAYQLYRGITINRQ